MLHIDSLQLAANGIRLEPAVNLTLNHGEALGLLGPNGCGKTTLLKTMAGLLPKRDGRVLFAEQSLLELSPRQRAQQLAIMVQHNGPCGGLNVEQVIALGKPADRPFDKPLFEQLLELCQLNELRRKPLEQLSGGQLQRTMLAQALFQDTQLLLLDEPANHLDLYHLHHLLQTLKQRQLTTVASFHDLNLAAQYCDKLLLLGEGCVQAFGAPEQVLTKANIAAVFAVDAQVSRNCTGQLSISVTGVLPTRRN